MISVIIPCYNAGNTVFRTVRSVMENTLSSDFWELIIIDDGSADGSSAKLRLLAKEYSNVKYFYQSNLGVNKARKAGVLFAVHPFVTFIDADDIIQRDYLANAVDVLTRVNCDVIFSEVKNVHLTYGQYGGVNIGSIVSPLLRQSAPNYIFGAFYSKSILLNINWALFETVKVGEDLLMKLCVLASVQKVWVCNYLGYIYSPVEQGVMANHVNSFEYTKEYCVKLNNVITQLGISEFHDWRSKGVWAFKLLVSVRHAEVNLLSVVKEFEKVIGSRLLTFLLVPLLLVLRYARFR